MANNAGRVETSIIDFNAGDKRFLALQTYADNNGAYYSPGFDQIGLKENQVNKQTHNHPAYTKYDDFYTERYSMGESYRNGRPFTAGDYQIMQNKNNTFPYQVYFPKSNNLYSIKKDGIKLIRNVKTSNDLRK